MRPLLRPLFGAIIFSYFSNKPFDVAVEGLKIQLPSGKFHDNVIESQVDWSRDADKTAVFGNSPIMKPDLIVWFPGG
jgi:hypothetical protein